MIKLGQYQTLKVVKQVEFGVYLAEENVKDERVLLPARQVPEGLKVGDEIEVFLYKDSEDRPIATTYKPLLTMGEVKRLKVSQVTKVGAFLSWGLDKDLFLPFKQQTVKVSEGDEVLVSMYMDKSSRLCATMNVYEALRNDSTYRKDNTVTGTVYQISHNFGAFVAVDDIYSALIPAKAMYGSAQKIKIGEEITARVASVLPDGRLELAVRDKGYLQRNEDSELIMKLISDEGGVLPFSDKASPELILEKTGMSKAQFKRAVGKLLKEGRINLGSDRIELRK
ncbi:MAG: S1 RNA-binding domain-containing protein [Lachnospiraceae bacterium]|nr:S1 RNA-binding domain-containing protein [Lachnospiraceae bacterium]